MVCGGFACSRNALCALNVVYVYMIILGLVFLVQFGVSCSCLAIDRSRQGCRSVPGARCPTCGDKMLRHSDEALKILGGVGLFFSFTEILGVWLAMRYRNQKDPRANPSAFL
ncbi:hypothetical protein Q9233_017481 [Columba guinea]|nr:hypothetical protein Q9233_017481 [Columba guinea]